MTDVWSMVAELDPAMQSRLADVLETRGADIQQRAMRLSFLTDVPFPSEARVLEVGCGTGVLTRALARRPEVAEVVGIDPATSLLERARMLSAELPRITFLEGDGRALPVDSESFDVVVFDSTLSHIPGVEQALAEAHRVLRRPGWLAVFDGDYSTTTVAIGDFDPLQACVDLMMANSVNDRYLVRRLPALVRHCGFEVERLNSHGFIDMSGDGYMATVVERGIDMLQSFRQIADDTAASLRAEIRRRALDGTFFGHIAYASLMARKPA